MAMHAESAGGYEQSKLMAELIVKRFASRLGSGARHLRIVKPGYIIGNANNGLANRIDFIWRLVAGCLEIGAYNEDEAHYWISVADKARVAQGVLAGISGMERDSSQTVVKLLEGLFIADFWNVLREDFGFVLEPLPYAEWLKRMRATIMAGLESHPLFPVLYILERGSSIIGSKKVPAAADGARMKEVVRSNVKYLIGTGVLPTPEKQRMLLRTLYQQ
jgi:thioester reductase-like protein